MRSLSRFNQRIRNLVLLIAFAILTNIQLGAQTRDLYPQVHALLLEAETSSTNIQFLDDRSNPHTSIGSLYALAGYLEDAERASPDFRAKFPVPLTICGARGWSMAGWTARKRASTP